MDYDLDKIAVKKAAIQRADSTILVGDKSKFDRHAIAHVVAPQAASRLVSDGPPPAQLAEIFMSSGVDITVV